MVHETHENGSHASSMSNLILIRRCIHFQGECGMLIRSVSAKHSGTIQCSMGTANEPTESTDNMTLIVASE